MSDDRVKVTAERFGVGTSTVVRIRALRSYGDAVREVLPASDIRKRLNRHDRVNHEFPRLAAYAMYQGRKISELEALSRIHEEHRLW